MFFNFHKEKKIGIKKLTKVDLGLSKTSKQTHVGLFNGVLSFLDDSDVKRDGILLYDKKCLPVTCFFDRIQNPDGSFRSPKLRKGNDLNSFVDKVRFYSHKYPELTWYLAWSGLDSENIVFWLFNNKSNDYILAKKAFKKMSKVLTVDDNHFYDVQHLFQDKVDATSIVYQKELEVASQIGANSYNKVDLEKADKLYREVGFAGEQLIAEFLEKQQSSGVINSFRWMNSSRESGAPFDFVINEDSLSIYYIDVKSTRFDFSQYIYFSKDEVRFANQLDSNKYSVYRLYNVNSKSKNQRLRICLDCIDYMRNLDSEIIGFDRNLQQLHTKFDNIKIGVKPKDCFNIIKSSIILK